MELHVDECEDLKCQKVYYGNDIFIGFYDGKTRNYTNCTEGGYKLN